jgi:uncharacterized membrane protein
MVECQIRLKRVCVARLINIENLEKITMTKQSMPKRVDGTGRIEAFSDGVFAIIATLLIFQLHIPVLNDLSNSAVLHALVDIAPKGLSFAISFFTVAIFWVTHHYIFLRITHSNWKLIWYNNLLLFWLVIVPFTTGFIGSYPTQALVVCIYALNLFLAALSFSLLTYYVFFKSDLMPEAVSVSERWLQWKRGCLGFTLYGSACIVAFINVYAALIILVIIPFIFVVPRLMRETE